MFVLNKLSESESESESVNHKERAEFHITILTSQQVMLASTVHTAVAHNEALCTLTRSFCLTSVLDV